MKYYIITLLLVISVSLQAQIHRSPKPIPVQSSVQVLAERLIHNEPQDTSYKYTFTISLTNTDTNMITILNPWFKDAKYKNLYLYDANDLSHTDLLFKKTMQSHYVLFPDKRQALSDFISIIKPNETKQFKITVELDKFIKTFVLFFDNGLSIMAFQDGIGITQGLYYELLLNNKILDLNHIIKNRKRSSIKALYFDLARISIRYRLNTPLID